MSYSDIIGKNHILSYTKVHYSLLKGTYFCSLLLKSLQSFQLYKMPTLVSDVRKPVFIPSTLQQHLTFVL